MDTSGKTLLWVSAGVLLLLLLKSNNVNAAGNGSGAISQGGLDLSGLADTYGAENVQRLASLYNATLNRGLTDQQILEMLSQALHETGLFTDTPNYKNMDSLHNYAGLTDTSGSYASYANLSDFVDDWLTFLTKNNNPLGASSLSDFNNRLKANHYYTDNASTYYNALSAYYNLLNQQPVN